jgi:hypothetical protein
MGTIYRVYERNLGLQYYNNTLDNYTLNSCINCACSAFYYTFKFLFIFHNLIDYKYGLTCVWSAFYYTLDNYTF